MNINRVLFIVVVLVIAIPVIVFLLSKNNSKTPVNSTPIQKTPDICEQFEGPVITGEISCKEAISITLKKHPGKVDYVKKEEVTYRIPPVYKVQAKKEMWILGMTLDSPQYIRSPETPDYTVEIVVDKSDGTIRSIREIYGY